MATTEWSRTTKRLVVIGLLILLFLVLYLVRPLLPPLAIAGVLAYVLKPIVDLIERRAHVPRLLAVGVVFLVLLVLVGFGLATGIPYLVGHVARLNVDLQRLADDIVTFLSQPIVILGYTFNLEQALGDIEGAIQSLLRPFASQTVTLLFGVASSLFWILSILVIAFYLVRDAGQLRGFLDRVAPPRQAEEFRRLRSDVAEVWRSFFRGQVVLALIIGTAVWICMSIVGLPNAGLMGLISGLLEVIPNFGPILATIPALLVALFRGSTYLPVSNLFFAAIVLAVYAVIQQIENAFLVPRIMGRRLLLHPAIVFVGVLAGGILAGALGIFLAAPVIGTLRVLLRYTYAKLSDQEPFPPELQPGEIFPGEFDAILFDLDGTLVETDDQAVEALSRHLRRFGWLFARRDPKLAARRFALLADGPANKTLALLDRLGLDDELFSLGSRLRRVQGLLAPGQLRPVEGVHAMLRDMERRYQLAIVTTRSRAAVSSFLSEQGLAGLFQVVTGREDTWRLKPHPSPITRTAQALGVPIQRCLMVGDTAVDMRAARAAGARAVGVLCGFGTRNDLERAGADLVIETTRELQELL